MGTCSSSKLNNEGWDNNGIPKLELSLWRFLVVVDLIIKAELTTSSSISIGVILSLLIGLPCRVIGVLSFGGGDLFSGKTIFSFLCWLITGSCLCPCWRTSLFTAAIKEFVLLIFD